MELPPRLSDHPENTSTSAPTGHGRCSLPLIVFFCQACLLGQVSRERRRVAGTGRRRNRRRPGRSRGRSGRKPHASSASGPRADGQGAVQEFVDEAQGPPGGTVERRGLLARRRRRRRLCSQRSHRPSGTHGARRRGGSRGFQGVDYRRRGGRGRKDVQIARECGTSLEVE